MLKLAMPNKTPKKDDPEQSKRFIDAAKDLELDESGKKFERAMDTLRPKPPATGVKRS